MKHCPTCNRDYSDPNLSFCTEDGTPLVPTRADYDPEATRVSASSSTGRGNAGSVGPGGTESRSDNWNVPAYQPPSQYAPLPAAKQRRAWPWAVGIVVLLLFAVVGIGIAAGLVIPKMIRAARERENNSNLNANTPPYTNANRESSVNDNANSSVVNANANANSNVVAATDAPTDEDEVLSDLTDLEKEWTVANLKADKKKLAHILADDYVGTQDGIHQGKPDYLRDIKEDKSIEDWRFEDLALTLKGDRATLKGTVRMRREGDDDNLVLKFTDKFVWRDGRWQAVASEVSRVK
jgi:hypothetical protein